MTNEKAWKLLIEYDRRIARLLVAQFQEGLNILAKELEDKAHEYREAANELGQWIEKGELAGAGGGPLSLVFEGVAEGAWTSYSKMHDRYLYRQSSYSTPTEGPEDVEEKRHKGKKAVSSGESDASGKLPLDI